jgi:DNA-binding MarR family transcriptional regulator
MSSVSDLYEKQLHLLLKLYEIIEAYRNSFVNQDQLTQQLGLDDALVDRLIYHLVTENLITRRWLTTISLTHIGIKEIESVLENPELDTTYFPAYSLAQVKEDNRCIYEIYHNSKKTRSAFLNKVYEVTQGNENIVIESYDIGHALGFDKNTLDRVYHYLIDEGSILYRHTGGGISINHKGYLTAEESSEPLKFVSPSKMLDSLIDLIEEINNISRIKLGCKLFNPSPKIIKDLKNIGNSEDTFVVTILRIASIIDQVYYHEIQQQLRQKPPQGSINLLSTLLREKNVNYNQKDFQTLRKLQSLRSTKQPVHSGEHEAISILKTLGIEYPFNWEKAGKICLQLLISSLTGLKNTINTL